MNLKIALVAAIMLTGGTYVSQAQQKTNATQTAASSISKKNFENKIATFEKTTDAAKAGALLTELRQHMVDGATSMKTEAKNATDKAQSDKLMQLLMVRGKAISEVMNMSPNMDANKTAIVKSLKDYATTL